MHQNDNSSISVLHIVAGDLNGGAARGALWLHQGLLMCGVDSKLLINSSDTQNIPTVYSTVITKREKLINYFNIYLDKLPLKMYRKRQEMAFSTSLIGYDIKSHELYKSCNVVHLHWINKGFINIRHLSKVKKPIVWTMRDMWPMTGGCHVSMDCAKFVIGCGHCPQLGSSNKYDLSSYVFRRKKRFYSKNMKIVGISEWISERARESNIFNQYDIRTIYNNLNCTDDFYPLDKRIARKVLGLETRKKIILAEVQSINNIYKGFNKYLEALTKLKKEQYYLVFYGETDSELLDQLGYEYMNMGVLKDLISLRLVYSCADVFVAPSLYDAFCKTIAEAMACGTSVVCFNATGPKEIVDHKINGYLSKAYDPSDLANGIEWILNHKEPEILSRQARKKAIENYDSYHIAQKYIELYKEIIIDT